MGWGYTWVPWFFMLSAFILTYTRLSKKSPGAGGPAAGLSLAEGWVFVKRRTASVYPLYACSLVVALGQQACNGKLVAVRPTALLAQVLLLQAWMPSEAEHALQPHCWFLSSILPYWFLHSKCLSILDARTTRSICVLLVALAALPWVGLVLVPMGLGVPYPYDWYGAHHRWQTSRTWLDMAVVVLKYHPLCYFHLYIFGMCLAILFLRHGAASRSRAAPWGRVGSWVVGNGAVLGYLGLALVFSLPALRPPSHKLLCRLGGLAPLQGLLLLGLAHGSDAAARLLQVPATASITLLYSTLHYTTLN